MLGRAAFETEVLASLGYMSIVYSGLDEGLATFLAALLNPVEQETAFDVARRFSFQQKLSHIERLVRLRCKQFDLNYEKELKEMLKIIRAAGDRRNELVHGFAALSTEKDRTPISVQAGGKHRRYSQQEIDDTIKELSAAYIAATRVWGLVWNATFGVPGNWKKVLPEKLVEQLGRKTARPPTKKKPFAKSSA